MRRRGCLGAAISTSTAFVGAFLSTGFGVYHRSGKEFAHERPVAMKEI